MRPVNTVEAARALAERHLQSLDSQEPLALLDDQTREHAWGWIFFYSSRAYAQTRDERHSLVGAGPLLVEKGSGRLWALGSAHEVGHYIGNYLRTGDPHAD